MKHQVYGYDNSILPLIDELTYRAQADATKVEPELFPYLKGITGVLCLLHPKTEAFYKHVFAPAVHLNVHLAIVHPEFFDRFLSENGSKDKNLIVSPACLSYLASRHLSALGPFNRVILGGSLAPSWLSERLKAKQIFEVFANSQDVQPLFMREFTASDPEPLFRQICETLPSTVKILNTDVSLTWNNMDEGCDVFIEKNSGGYYYLGNTRKSLKGKFLTQLERHLDGLYPNLQTYVVKYGMQDEILRVYLSDLRSDICEEISSFVTKTYNSACEFFQLTPTDVDSFHGKKIILI